MLTPPLGQPPIYRHPATCGMGITSMVLGIISIVTCLIPLGIFAVIFGHVSLSRIKRSGGLVTGAGMAIAGLVMGYLTSAICFLAVGLIVYAAMQEVKLEGNAEDIFPLPVFEESAFPEWNEGRVLEGAGVRLHDLKADFPGPAGATSLRILIPAGEHAPASLPCVLVAPAGTDLLSGSDLDDGTYLDESLPYAEAGMVVILYSIDGGDEAGEAAVAYGNFREASAGVANGAFAYAFASSRIPAVDPACIYSAGHSSAATLSLLLAAHLPDLAGAIAYAPATDVAGFHAGLVESPFSGMRYPGVETFVKRSSPLTHAAKVKVPVFLFGAQDDDMVDTAELRSYARFVEEAGGAVEVKTVANGGHYDSMIVDGIPAGIAWIRSQ
jgi:dienelactone hydrolase